MKIIEVNGKQVKTNLNENYSRLPDDMLADALPFGMTEEKYLKQLVDMGYTKVTFYYATTRVRGYHKIFVKCKK